MEKFVRELLTEKVLEKVASLYGVTKEELYYVGGFENFIYGFDREGKSYIVRISHSCHRTVDEVKAEIDFLYYLANHAANVSTPFSTVNKELVERIDCPDESYFIICAFTKAEGEVPSRQNANDRMFYNYGKTIALFHKLTKDYRESEGIQKRFSWDQDLIILNADKYLPKEDRVILDRLNETITAIKSIEKNRDNYGLIHTDVHMGNFFVRDDELIVFDFDDSCYHYFISDIAIALFYLIFMVKEEEQFAWVERFLPLFLKGYFEGNKLSKDDFMKIPLFLKLREIILYIVVFRTLDTAENRFAKAYINRYRDRIVKNTPFIDLDFEKYYHLYN